MKNNQPDYKTIYSDILHKKPPEKKAECFPLLEKENLSVLDIIELNKKIFGIADRNPEAETKNTALIQIRYFKHP